ncbi:BRISC complex subunit FAM175B-like [Hyposmocoma kahamanoa]|uniref:BRISC complex subunit FAM175B-like n=1 Tax=Hyposmocoma kahamanoa TaxID=1477025 RepID=UPI000E6D7870|nr:BRISC complex subunit FAM175B-like [Hyposmocoma kahamanoa]
MAYTEKVSISGTALSFLLYECVNSINSQEGFLIGDITSEVTNHISDSQSDNARLDTQIVIRTVLPLPSVALFYFPTGRIKEDVLSDLLSKTASEVVGWYKYRKDSNIKPTFRDKLISKGLQKYFEKHHGKKNFVTCNLSSKTSSASSTHTFMYRFGKINCFDMYEYVDDITANLGEKHTGYKKALRLSPHSIFNKIVKESNVQSNNTSDAILRIQEAVNFRLMKEAKLAAKNESTIRELEAEIKQINTILSDKLSADLQTSHEKMVEEKFMNREIEMAKACVEALHTPTRVDILNIPNIVMNNHLSNSDTLQLAESGPKGRSPSPVLIPSSSNKPGVLNYAAALKNKNEKPSTSKSNNFSDDLISFDVEENHVQKINFINDDVKCIGDSSPDY